MRQEIFYRSNKLLPQTLFQTYKKHERNSLMKMSASDVYNMTEKTLHLKNSLLSQSKSICKDLDS